MADAEIDIYILGVYRRTMFDPAKYIQEKSQELSVLATNTVLVAVSGGVDSLTSALMLRHAGVPTRLLYIDTGFQRDGELDEVRYIFEQLAMELDVVDVSGAFLAATRSYKTPHDKREAFRNVYYTVIADYMEVHNLQYTVQGTQSHRTTTQVGHNAPHAVFTDKQYTMIEPVMGLTKNQVRLVAKTLGAAPEMYQRMPFPGPGLLIRISGAPTQEKIDVIRKATKIIDDAIAANLKLRTEGYQIFPYLASDVSLPYRDSHGQTRFASAIYIRSLKMDSANGTTHYVPLRFPEHVESVVISELMALPGIARVLFDLTPKTSQGLQTLTPTGIEFS